MDFSSILAGRIIVLSCNFKKLCSLFYGAVSIAIPNIKKKVNVNVIRVSSTISDYQTGYLCEKMSVISLEL